jgi:hypothetical protein
MVMGPTGPETMIYSYCAGEGQRQFNRPTAVQYQDYGFLRCRTTWQSDYSTLNEEAVRCCETLVPVHQTNQYHILSVTKAYGISEETEVIQ